MGNQPDMISSPDGQEIVKESKSKNFGGVVKLFTLPRAKPRYAKIGFVDTDGSGEMILTQTNSEAFLES